MSIRVQHFLFAVIAQLLMPLTPLTIEFWLNGGISDVSLAIATAMYSISVAVSTKNLAILGCGMFTGLIYSSLFGFLVSGNSAHFSIKNAAIFTIVTFMIIHAVERYRRHVDKGELFIDFAAIDE